MRNIQRRLLLVLIAQLWCIGASAQPVAQTSVLVKDEQHQVGIELYQQGNIKAAANVFKALLKKNKADSLSSYYLGLCLAQQNKSKEASKAFENAVRIKPDFLPALIALSRSHVNRNKHSEALQTAERALKLDPTLAEAHYIVGVVSLRSGNPQEALLKANETISLAPKIANAHLLRSLALLGVYTKKARENSNSPMVQVSSPGPPTPEERERRRQQRLEVAATFREAASSLNTFLQLQPTNEAAQQWREQLETLEFYATHLGRDKDTTPATDRLWSGDEVTTKVRVLMKPEPAYTDEAKARGVTGTVILRAVFAADGTVRHILTLASLPQGLTEQAIRAARRIKFVPATVNGMPVSMVLQLEYNFNLY